MEQQIEEQTKPFIESITDLMITIKPYISLLLSEWKNLLIINGSIFVLTLLYLLFLAKPYYQSTVTILPEFGGKSSDMLSQFSGLAAMAGVNVGGDVSTQIYQNLVMSETVLNDVIYKKYETKEYNHPVDLVEYFEVKPDKSLPDSLQKRKMFLTMFLTLSKVGIVTNYEMKTKILTITTQMPESKLSADVANTTVQALDKYVRMVKKSFASEQRKYLEARLIEIKDTLTIFENQLKSFREKNRQITQSPELQLEQARLMRNVEIQQTIFTELTKQYELVKLAEVKDVPVVNIREYAKDPVVKTGPKRILTLIVILFFSFIGSASWILWKKRVMEIIEKVKRG